MEKVLVLNWVVVITGVVFLGASKCVSAVGVAIVWNPHAFGHVELLGEVDWLLFGMGLEVLLFLL